jgi:hypothetical protein
MLASIRIICKLCIQSIVGSIASQVMYQHTRTYYPKSLYFYLQLLVIFLHISFCPNQHDHTLRTLYVSNRIHAAVLLGVINALSVGRCGSLRRIVTALLNNLAALEVSNQETGRELASVERSFRGIRDATYRNRWIGLGIQVGVPLCTHNPIFLLASFVQDLFTKCSC